MMYLRYQFAWQLVQLSLKQNSLNLRNTWLSKNVGRNDGQKVQFKQVKWSVLHLVLAYDYFNIDYIYQIVLCGIKGTSILWIQQTFSLKDMNKYIFNPGK